MTGVIEHNRGGWPGPTLIPASVKSYTYHKANKALVLEFTIFSVDALSFSHSLIVSELKDVEEGTLDGNKYAR